MSGVVVFDTSIFIDDLRRGRHQERIRSISGLIRTSAVVFAELGRTATQAAEREFLRTLARNHPILTPTEKNGQESGEILGKIHAARGFTPHKLRDLHFDLRIAVSARSHGARLVTTNRVDFEMINHYRRLRLEIW
jgi:predicted nucleic acid-binding protein